VENFWSLLKRGVGGTYIAVEPFHLFRYVDEQVFPFNNRKTADGEIISNYERFEHRSVPDRRQAPYLQGLDWKEAETASEEVPF